MAARNRMPPWHEKIHLANGREVLVRPIRPEDAVPLRAAFVLLEPDEVRQRFLHPMKELGVEQAERLTRESAGKASAALGRGILAFAPRLMKFLSIAGTAAMFLVGGGILVHGVPALHHAAEAIRAFPPGWLWENLFNAVVGVIAGALVLGVVTGIGRLRGKPAAPAH